MAIQFETDEYKRAHGERPSGSGTWGFLFKRADGTAIEVAPEKRSERFGNPWVWFANASAFGNAKYEAKEHGRKLGASVAVVQS